MCKTYLSLGGERSKHLGVGSAFERRMISSALADPAHKKSLRVQESPSAYCELTRLNAIGSNAILSELLGCSER